MTLSIQVIQFSFADIEIFKVITQIMALKILPKSAFLKWSQINSPLSFIVLNRSLLMRIIFRLSGTSFKSFNGNEDCIFSFKNFMLKNVRNSRYKIDFGRTQ